MRLGVLNLPGKSLLDRVESLAGIGVRFAGSGKCGVLGRILRDAWPWIPLRGFRSPEVEFAEGCFDLLAIDISRIDDPFRDNGQRWFSRTAANRLGIPEIPVVGVAVSASRLSVSGSSTNCSFACWTSACWKSACWPPASGCSASGEADEYSRSNSTSDSGEHSQSRSCLHHEVLEFRFQLSEDFSFHCPCFDGGLLFQIWAKGFVDLHWLLPAQVFPSSQPSRSASTVASNCWSVTGFRR